MRHQEDAGATPRANRRILAWLESQELSIAQESYEPIPTSFAAEPTTEITASRSQSTLKRPASTFSDSDVPNKRSRLDSSQSSASKTATRSFDSEESDSMRFCKETEWEVREYYGYFCWLCQHRVKRTEICHIIQEDNDDVRIYPSPSRSGISD